MIVYLVHMLLFFGFIIGLLMNFLVTACYVLVISFTLWMAIDAGKQDRFWWLAIVIGIPIIGPSVYYFTEKKHEYRLAPVHHIHTVETEQQHEKAPKKKSSRKAKSKEIKEEKESLSVVENKEESIVENPEIKNEEVLVGENIFEAIEETQGESKEN